MMTLREALEATPRPLVLTICRRLRRPVSSNLPKAELVEQVHQALAQPEHLPETLHRLRGPQRRALTDLHIAGGQLPLRHLQPHHGPLPPPRPLLQRLQASRRQPQADPLSALEGLALQGLVFLHRPTRTVFIPRELLAHLPELTPLQRGGAALAPSGRSAADPAPVLVAHDLAGLLGLLQRQAVRPVHGRWLPPRLLASWGQACCWPPANPEARGERQTGRRRFLHYLAENGGLVPAGEPWLIPTPAAWLWLRGSSGERLQALWQSWTTPDLARWRTFRLPGYRWLPDPARLLAAIHQGLAEQGSQGEGEQGGRAEAILIEPEGFSRWLLLAQPWLHDLVPANLSTPVELLRETITALLVGPLVWLGVLVVAGSREDGVERRESHSATKAGPPGPPTGRSQHSPLWGVRGARATVSLDSLGQILVGIG